MWSRRREEDVGPSPWPLIRGDGRTLRVRVVDTMASVEAMRIRSKKQYEKDRSDSNGTGILPRCPLKGTGLHKIGARRHMILDRDFPALFTVCMMLYRHTHSNFFPFHKSHCVVHQTLTQRKGCLIGLISKLISYSTQGIT